MHSELLRILIYSTGILLGSLLILLIPLKVLAMITTPFSFKTFGIRRIKRWHSHTDTLANLMLWISLIFCFAAPWIPYSPVIYAVWLTFTWLCALARAVRLSEVGRKWKKLVVIFFLNMIYGFGLLCGIGAFSYFSLPIRAFLFANEIAAGQGTNPMFYLTSPQPAAYLLQSLLMVIPLFTLWGQFKYMRLENTFKARNIWTYMIKYAFVIALIAALGLLGQRGIEKIYQVSGDARISSSNTFCPLSREDVLEQEDGSAQQDAGNENSPEPASDNPEEQPGSEAGENGQQTGLPSGESHDLDPAPSDTSEVPAVSGSETPETGA